MNKKYKDKQWLQSQYKNKTSREIAQECGTTHQTILRWLKKFDIERRHGKSSYLEKQIINPNVDYTKKYRNKDWLINEYKTKSIQQIARENDISKTALRKWFIKFDIKKQIKTKSKLTNPKYFDTINSSIKAYWLGFLMADGANSCGVLEMKLSITDLEHMKLFKKDVGWIGKIHTGYGKCLISNNEKLHEYCFIGISSKYMTEVIQKYGIIPNKTGKETFPNIPKKYYPDFIRGYFDGDGSYSYYYRYNKGKYKTLNSSIKIVCMNHSFLKDVKNKLVQYANIKEEKIHIYPAKSIWSLEISSNESIEKFYNYIYPKYCRRFLKRKRDKFQEPLLYIKNHKK